MSAGAVGAGAAVAGLGLGIVGNIMGNNAQAKAEEANAAYYNEQKEYARQAMLRNLDIFKDQASETIGTQTTAASAGGVTLSGSPLLVLASSRARQIKEEAAIRYGGEANIREAYLRAGASMDNANRLGSFAMNGLPAIGSALGTIGTLSNYYGGSSGGGGQNVPQIYPTATYGGG